MCGRFTLQTSARTLAKWFEGVTFPSLFPRYNIAPTQDVLSVRLDENGMIQAGFLRWGLIPSWSKDTRMASTLINARSETASTKPAFRHAFKRQRCLIVADGFYEWKNLEKGKQPYLIRPSREFRETCPFLCFAGLWDRCNPPLVQAAAKPLNPDPQMSLFDKDLDVSEPLDSSVKPPSQPSAQPQIIESCSLLTTSANAFMATIHDRMPVILDREGQQAWLQADSGIEALQSLLLPAPVDLLEMYPVSPRVNKASYDHIDCTDLLDSKP